MKLNIIFFVFACFSGIAYAQQRPIFGTIVDENDFRISNVIIINLTNNRKYFANPQGEFMIYAKEGDAIRFVKDRYERRNHIITKNTQSPLKIILKRLPKEIKSVQIKRKLSGNLAKDVKMMEESKRKQRLNRELDRYIATSSPPIQDPREFSQNQPITRQQGTVDFLKVAAKIGGLLFKKKRYASTHATKEKFLSELKQKINIDYYRSLGMKSYDIDRFLAYADNRFKLEEKFHNNINILSIQRYLDDALHDFEF